LLLKLHNGQFNTILENLGLDFSSDAVFNLDTYIVLLIFAIIGE